MKPRVGVKSVPVGDPSERAKPENFLDIGTIPVKPGETQMEGLARIKKVIGQKLSDIPAMEKLWNEARDNVLKKNTLTQDNYEELYDKTREAFWRRVRKDPQASQLLGGAGFGLSGGKTSAPLLTGAQSTIAVEDTRISLDHVVEKAQGDNWKKALDADNLRMEFASPNTEREIKQRRHPELR